MDGKLILFLNGTYSYKGEGWSDILKCMVMNQVWNYTHNYHTYTKNKICYLVDNYLC